MYTAHSHEFEGFRAHVSLAGLKYKLETEHRNAVGITTGPAAVDVNGRWAANSRRAATVDSSVQSAIDAKAAREAFFPMELLAKAIGFDCKNGQASVEDDRTRILSLIGDKATQLNTKVQGMIAMTALHRILVESNEATNPEQEVIAKQRMLLEVVHAVKHGIKRMTIDLPTTVDTTTNLGMLMDAAAYERLVISTNKCWKMPLALWQCNSLTTLDLRAPMLKQLYSITDLQSLQELTLRECTSLRALPENLNELKHLRLLNIRLCKMRGLPDCIAAMSCHMYINMYACEDSLRPCLAKLENNQRYAEEESEQKFESNPNFNSGICSLSRLSVPSMLKWFDHIDWDIRKIAVDSLSQLPVAEWKAEERTQLLETLDCSSNWYARAAAVELLKHLLENWSALNMKGDSRQGSGAQLALRVLHSDRFLDVLEKLGVDTSDNEAVLELSPEKLATSLPRLLRSVNSEICARKVTQAEIEVKASKINAQNMIARTLAEDRRVEQLKAQAIATSAKAKFEWLKEEAKAATLELDRLTQISAAIKDKFQSAALRLLANVSDVEAVVVQAAVQTLIHTLNELPLNSSADIGFLKQLRCLHLMSANEMFASDATEMYASEPDHWLLALGRSLIARTTDPEWRVRKVAVKVFGKWPVETLMMVAPYLIGRLEDDEWSPSAALLILLPLP